MSKQNITPMMEQYLKIKNKYKDCIVLFRLGDFYETFFEDARKVSEELQIVLTSRNGNPMAGVPYHAIEQYTNKLLQNGHKIAICDQMEDPSLAKGLVKRDITRVLTPGTVIEDALLKNEINNYILSITFFKNSYQISIADISTGEVGIGSFKSFDEINDIIYKFDPRQILLNKADEHYIKKQIENDRQIYVESFESWNYAYSSSVEYVKKFYNLSAIDSLEMNREEITNLGSLFKYLQETQFKYLEHLNLPSNIAGRSTMKIDSTTAENLNLVNGEKNNLFATLKETVTSAGTRNLKRNILNPLLVDASINRRLDVVEIFFNDGILHKEIRENLKKVYDIQRICSRLSMDKMTTRDIEALRNTLNVLPDIKEILRNYEILNSYFEDIELFIEEKKLLNSAIMENPGSVLGEGNVIKSGYNEKLDKYRNLLSNSNVELKKFESEEKRKTGIQNLRIKNNKVFGYFIEVSKGNLSKVPDTYIRKQTLVNCERFITEDLKNFEEEIFGAQINIDRLEREIFKDICLELKKSIVRFQKLSVILAELDLLQSFAEISKKNNYCRPSFSDDNTCEIINSRHPVVEKNVENYIANNVYFNSENKFYILTGPNMSGKSTYLRQIALISILAQIGCFIPSEKGLIPIYDRIFTRIGARDDISSGKSTFLVEMMETSIIVNKATEKSLVVLDEVGRGTSTFDGISLAWSVSEYIYEAIGCNTIFATHFTELTELSNMYSGINNINVKVLEERNDIVFLHKIINGISSKSHGIKVAKLAGIPELILKRSEEILEVIQKTSSLDKTVKVLSNKEIEEIKKKKTGKMNRNQIKMFN
ncbi:MAG: mismatch repair protein MutS [Kosmotogales bacterium]|nr:mismatch repair protein MutS [Kosmotogales bacterium]